MLSKTVIREIKRISIGVFALYAVMLIVFKLLGYLDIPVVLGGFLGSVYAIVNFVLLSITIENSFGKGTKGAQASMGTSYMIRLLVTAVVIYWAIKAPYFNYIAAAIPLVFPRFVIMALTFIDSKKGGSDK